jgi:hypothetical protein
MYQYRHLHESSTLLMRTLNSNNNTVVMARYLSSVDITVTLFSAIG